MKTNKHNKNKTWSRKKIYDRFTNLKKLNGEPMCRQAIHMMRKKDRHICLTCGTPSIGVYCLTHTIAARERMRQKHKYQRRLTTSLSYRMQANLEGKQARKEARWAHVMP